ncbi:excisionase family DNA-binding protein [Actinacidiphila sp. ITFR-21]|uniref:excisionase family DNA-binding protein n=1 Tax=Actinacidiphila sp. ITFR-21 TaxID=3075199 RepID=UPI002889C44B|nr:excisionase family DNA-binding protein [Streptomyces sp. ITFR-21]WNI15715.1 excisionase family DNA-binding protein [Streptomyces sp. ITFR-21]
MTATVTESASETAADASELVLLTVEEAAYRLRIGRTTCYKLIRTGALASVTVGSLRRVPAEAVPECVAHLPRGAHRAA